MFFIPLEEVVFTNDRLTETEITYLLNEECHDWESDDEVGEDTADQ